MPRAITDAVGGPGGSGAPTAQPQPCRQAPVTLRRLRGHLCPAISFIIVSSSGTDELSCRCQRVPGGTFSIIFACCRILVIHVVLTLTPSHHSPFHSRELGCSFLFLSLANPSYGNPSICRAPTIHQPPSSSCSRRHQAYYYPRPPPVSSPLCPNQSVRERQRSLR